MKYALIKLHWVLSTQLGIDPLRFLQSMRGLPLYIKDWWRFRQSYSGKLNLVPCLHDRYEEGGATKSEYFWQDLLVARAIHAANPDKHVDVGSRVDGFVAHIASFRECEVFDVREITTVVPGVIFHQADLMRTGQIEVSIGGEYCDSLSCLHAIEHFGLGRYGDMVDPQGYKRGIANMAKLLCPGGTFYLSTPIGQQRVEFNANWIFDPQNIVRCSEEVGMELQKLIVITSEEGPKESEFDAVALADIATRQYQLGLFYFKKKMQ